MLLFVAGNIAQRKPLLGNSVDSAMTSASILDARARKYARNTGTDFYDCRQQCELRILELSRIIPAELREEYREWLARKAPSDYLFRQSRSSDVVEPCPWAERQYVTDHLPPWVRQYVGLTTNGGLSEVWADLGSPRFVLRNRSNLEIALIAAIVDNDSVCFFVSQFT